MKKTINPFKLTGSYIGLSVGLILAFLSYNSLKVICQFSTCRASVYLIFLLTPIISGFLIGWGMHTLIRRLRK